MPPSDAHLSTNSKHVFSTHAIDLIDIIDSYSQDPIVVDDGNVTLPPNRPVNETEDFQNERLERHLHEQCDWCQSLFRCAIMSTSPECLCCTEIKSTRQIVAKCGLGCITEHEEFVTLFCAPCVCLHRARHRELSTHVRNQDSKMCCDRSVLR